MRLDSILHTFGLPTTQPRREQLEEGTTEISGANHTVDRRFGRRLATLSGPSHTRPGTGRFDPKRTLDARSATSGTCEKRKSSIGAPRPPTELVLEQPILRGVLRSMGLRTFFDASCMRVPFRVLRRSCLTYYAEPFPAGSRRSQGMLGYPKSSHTGCGEHTPPSECSVSAK